MNKRSICLGLFTTMMTPLVTLTEDRSDSGIAERYRQAAERIMTATMAGNDSYLKMEQLCDEIGPRLSGSPQLAKAVKWAAAAMERNGQQNVRLDRNY